MLAACRLAAELDVLAAALGIQRIGSESIGDAAHREAWAEEMATGMSPDTRARHDIAVANAEIFGSREAARGAHGSTAKDRLARAERELEQARRSVARALAGVRTGAIAAE